MGANEMTMGAFLETLDNLPTMRGRTLVLVDVSRSMDMAADDTGGTYRELATLFASVIAYRSAPGRTIFMAYGETPVWVPVGDYPTLNYVRDRLGGIDLGRNAYPSDALEKARLEGGVFDTIVVLSDTQVFAPRASEGKSIYDKFTEYMIYTGTRPTLYSINLAGDGTGATVTVDLGIGTAVMVDGWSMDTLRLIFS